DGALPRGDVRPGGGALPVRDRRRGGGAGQRHRLRAERVHLDLRRRARARARRPDQGRYGQHQRGVRRRVRLLRRPDGRHEGVRAGPQARHGGPAALHRVADRGVPGVLAAHGAAVRPGAGDVGGRAGDDGEGDEVAAGDVSGFDVVVIGSGFGGSVSALRLAEKGYRVAVLEAGRRFGRDTLPATSWRLRDFLWAPWLGLKGIQRIHLLRGEKGAGVMVLAGAGVGGGSLVYANTLYEPLDPFYRDPQWASITDWKAELAPYYDQAKRMLGVTLNPAHTPADEVMRKIAERMGVGGTFRPAPVGVYFGPDGADPYFGGAGPERRGCVQCGECMTGCRRGAKNMLTENYLYLAERAGARVYAECTVTSVRPLPSGGYGVLARRTGAARQRRIFTARQVVFAAGAWGTQRLLHRLRDRGTLPRVSARLGMLTRTNSEALLGFERRGGEKLNAGVAITSSFHPDAETHLEPVRSG